MASSASEVFFGFELLQKLYDNDIVKKEDIIILFVHWCFIKHGFKCIGITDSKAFDATEKGSELLPEQWNKKPNYTIRYVRDGKLYIFHGIKSDEDLLLNLLRTEDHNVFNSQFPIGEVVTELHGPLESVIPSYRIIFQIIKETLIEPICPDNSAQKSTQTTSASDETERQSRVDPLRVETQERHPLRLSEAWVRQVNEVGASDLDPFARNPRGMLFDPFSNMYGRTNAERPVGGGGLGMPGRLPRGAVPPGARFDPIGPQDPFGLQPDNSHLPLPNRHRGTDTFDYM